MNQAWNPSNRSAGIRKFVVDTILCEKYRIQCFSGLYFPPFGQNRKNCKVRNWPEKLWIQTPSTHCEALKYKSPSHLFTTITASNISYSTRNLTTFCRLLCVAILFHHLACVCVPHFSCVYVVTLSYHHSIFVVFTNHSHPIHFIYQSPSHSFYWS